MQSKRLINVTFCICTGNLTINISFEFALSLFSDSLLSAHDLGFIYNGIIGTLVIQYYDNKPDGDDII